MQKKYMLQKSGNCHEINQEDNNIVKGTINVQSQLNFEKSNKDKTVCIHRHEMKFNVKINQDVGDS
jgi:hypothetical protein